MNQVVLELGILLMLVLGNGVFAMAEIALVSSRRSKLQALADSGDARARAALELATNPNRFLATVQIGITMIGIVAGAYSGATLADKLGTTFHEMGVPEHLAVPTAFGLVVIGITFLSLVVGELVPKRMALGNPEGISLLMARPMTRVSRLTSPLVLVLGWATDQLLGLFGIKHVEENRVSEEEVKLILHEGLHSGVFLPSESAMVESVLALDRLPVREIMTPRAKIIWISTDEESEILWHKIVISGHTTYPVYEGHRDQVVGIVSLKNIYANLAAGVPVRVRDLMTPPLVVPATQTAIILLETFKSTGRHVALVADEFGNIVGLVSLHDVMEAIVGDFPSQDDRLRPAAKQREDGSWLVDGMLDIEEFDRGLPELGFQPPADRDYETVGGFVVKRLGHVPTEGEWFELNGYRVEVIDMDRHRVDKVLLMPLSSPHLQAARSVAEPSASSDTSPPGADRPAE